MRSYLWGQAGESEQLRPCLSEARRALVSLGPCFSLWVRVDRTVGPDL